MKILIMNPPFLKKYARSMRCPAVTKSGTIIYPYWLMHATGVLDKEAFEIRLIDAPADGLELADIEDRIINFSPDLTVLDTSTGSIHNDCQVGEIIKKWCPHSFVILVGPHVSALPKETLVDHPEIDAVARREYDETLKDLAYTLANKKDLEDVKGISFRKDNKIIHNPDRPFIENLDELPFISKVCKKYLNFKNYFYSADLYPIMTILGSRGCPYRCSYCLFPQTLTGHKFRLRSIGNIIDEMKYIRKEFPEVKEIKFEDDSMSEERCLQLAQAIIENQLNIPWTMNGRADLSFETLKTLRKSGCRLLCVGFESGSQNILNQMNKKITLNRVKQFMKDAKKAKVLIHGCFLVGGQGETTDTLTDTLQFAMELEPDTAQFFPMAYYPGTEAYKWAKENGYLLTEDFSKWLMKDGMISCIVSRPGLSHKALVDFCDYARRRFYLRPKYILKKMRQSLFNVYEAKRNFKALNTFRKHLLTRHIRQMDEA